MNDLFQYVFIPAAITASVLVWITVGRKILRGEALLPYEGRRPVPWKTGDVVVILGVYFSPMLLGLAVYFLPLLVGLAVSAFQGPSDDELAIKPEISLPLSAEASADQEVNTHHSAIDLLIQDGTALTWVLCFVAAVIVAPLAEEFLFRLVLQGWLESVEHRGRRRGMRRLARGAKPILVSSMLFAGIHFRWS